MYAIIVDGLGWVEKVGGWNLFRLGDEGRAKATTFATREEAKNARPMRHRGTGVSIFVGRVVKL